MKDLELSKVEVIRKEYDKKGYIIKEVWEYWFPKEKKTEIGYKTKK